MVHVFNEQFWTVLNTHDTKKYYPVRISVITNDRVMHPLPSPTQPIDNCLDIKIQNQRH